MGIKIYKPTSPGRRNSSVNDYFELTRSGSEKSLVKRIKKQGIMLRVIQYIAVHPICLETLIS